MLYCPKCFKIVARPKSTLYPNLYALRYLVCSECGGMGLKPLPEGKNGISPEKSSKGPTVDPES